MPVLGLDTSNYTTSAAVFDGVSGSNVGRLLDVPEGTLGLRQSDALFQHVKRLPDQIAQLREQGMLQNLAAVGASTRPREVEGSYMPCFLAGESLGKCLADTLQVPFFPWSHQQGHLAAAAWSAGRLDLLEQPFLAWHLSGGTTELLIVHPEGKAVRAECIGGTEDISAGQLIDRTGKLLQLSFPAGKALDKLAQTSSSTERFPVKLRGLRFSLSGMENKAKEMVQTGQTGEATAAFVLNTLADLLLRATKAALTSYPDLPLLCSGGVASNTRIRTALIEGCGAVFAEPQYSTDNAMGIAILTQRQIKEL